MNPIRINLEQLKNKTIPIGREGENEYTVVRIDCGKVFREHPQAEVSMKVKPPKGITYPVTVEREGNEIVWTVHDYDLASKGDGQFQLTFTDGTVICKTAIGRTLVLKSLEGNGPAPTPIDDWMQEAQEALDAVQDAEVNQPVIGEDGYWYTWNQEAGEYQKTDTKAEGQDGHTPVLTSSKSGKTTTIYADGDQLAQIQDGQDANIDDTSTAADKVWSAAKSSQLLSALTAISTFITPEMYGAKGDNSTDDTAAINACLAAAYNSGVRIPVRGNGRYKINGTILITGNEGNVYFHKIRYRGSEYAVQIQGQRNSIKIDHIEAENGSGIWITSENTGSISNNLSVNYIYAKYYCLKLQPKEGYGQTPYTGSFYDLGRLYAQNNNCIYIKDTFDDSVWKLGNLQSANDYGIKLDNTGCMTVLYAEIEGCYAGFDIKDAAVHLNGYIRTRELMDKQRYGVADKGLLAKLTGEAFIYGCENIDFTSIDASGISNTPGRNEKLHAFYVGTVLRSFNYYYYPDEPQYRKGNDNFFGDLYIVQNTKVLVPRMCLSQSVTQSINYNDLTYLPARYFTINADNCVLTLNSSYCPIGITEFIVDQTQHTCTIIDMYGDTIFNGAALGKGVYKIIATSEHNGIIPGEYDDSISDWIVTNGIAWEVQKISNSQAWELIREDSFTNATEADHEITLDGNNNAFELTDVLLLFETPKQNTLSAKGTYGLIKFFYGEGQYDYVSVYCNAYSQAANENAHGLWAKITNNDNLIQAEFITAVTNSNAGQIRSYYQENFSGNAQGIRVINNFSVNKIVINAVTGTGHYKLFGKRKP